MSSLKPIKWTRLVPIFLTAVLALPCLLMIVERSEHGALTTKAYTNSWQRVFTYWRLGSQFTYYNDYKVYTRIQLDCSSSYYKHAPRFCFNGTTTNGDELEYFIRVYNYGSYSNPLTESEWVGSNTWVQGFDIFAPKGGSHPDQTLECWVRRKDGGILTPSSLNFTMVSFDALCDEQVEFPTNPSSWYETTTASFQNPMDTYTTIIPTDYDISSSQYDPLLEIPSKIDTAINFIILGFGRIMNFRYISFVVCFVLIVGLVAWLIH